MTVSPYAPSKWLFQASPPDLTESRADARWTFGVYEILDHRTTPMEPRVLHTVYRGVVELGPDEIPDAGDPFFAGRLEERLVQRWKELLAEV